MNGVLAHENLNQRPACGRAEFDTIPISSNSPSRQSVNRRYLNHRRKLAQNGNNVLLCSVETRLFKMISSIDSTQWGNPGEMRKGPAGAVQDELTLPSGADYQSHGHLFHHDPKMFMESRPTEQMVWHLVGPKFKSESRPSQTSAT